MANKHRIILFFFTWLPLSAWQADAKTLYVASGNAGTPPYQTPQTAAGTIEEALQIAGDGDVLDVGPGHYHEDVRMHPGMVLSGAGPDATLIWGTIFGADDNVVRDLVLLHDSR